MISWSISTGMGNKVKKIFILFEFRANIITTRMFDCLAIKNLV